MNLYIYLQLATLKIYKRIKQAQINMKKIDFSYFTFQLKTFSLIWQHESNTYQQRT